MENKNNDIRLDIPYWFKRINNSSIYGIKPITQKNVEEEYCSLYRNLKESLDIIHNIEATEDISKGRISLEKLERIIAGMRMAIDSHEKMIKNVKRPEDVII